MSKLGTSRMSFRLALGLPERSACPCPTGIFSLDCARRCGKVVCWGSRLSDDARKEPRLSCKLVGNVSCMFAGAEPARDGLAVRCGIRESIGDAGGAPRFLTLLGVLWPLAGEELKPGRVPYCLGKAKCPAPCKRAGACCWRKDIWPRRSRAVS